MIFWDLSKLDQGAFSLDDLILQIALNFSEVSDIPQIVFKLIDNGLWRLLKPSDLNQLFDSGCNMFLLALGPLVCFPVILNLLDESSKLDRVS